MNETVTGAGGPGLSILDIALDSIDMALEFGALRLVDAQFERSLQVLEASFEVVQFAADQGSFVVGGGRVGRERDRSIELLQSTSQVVFGGEPLGLPCRDRIAGGAPRRVPVPGSVGRSPLARRGSPSWGRRSWSLC